MRLHQFLLQHTTYKPDNGKMNDFRKLFGESWLNKGQKSNSSLFGERLSFQTLGNQ